MKFVLATAVAAAMVFGAANATAETRALSNFTSVKAYDHLVVEVRNGAQYSVEVTGPQADRIATSIDLDGALKINERNRPWFGPDRRVDALVRVTMPNVTDLAAAKGATLTAFDITGEDVSIVAAMGGELTINGSCHSVDATAAMGGTLRADNFHCLTADISAAMGGDARVFATQTFDATAAMGGSVHIAGGAHGDTTAAMGGSIQIADGGRSDDTTAVMGGNVSTR
ncbi:MAG: DUF2807 domain-containing protein [Terricaulis sp.]